MPIDRDILRDPLVVVLEAERDALLAQVGELAKKLLECRQEFCWTGNTGKTLSADSYGALIDSIDAVLAKVKP